MSEQQPEDDREKKIGQEAYDKIVEHERRCFQIWTAFAMLFVTLLVAMIAGLFV